MYQSLGIREDSQTGHLFGRNDCVTGPTTPDGREGQPTCARNVEAERGLSHTAGAIDDRGGPRDGSLEAARLAAALGKDQFMSFVAHELRTPLTPIAMLLQSLERKVRLGAPIDLESIARARRQTTRLARMIGDAVDLSRVCEQRLELDRARMDLTELLQEVVNSAASTMHKHRLELSVSSTLPVYGDRARLERAIGNLIEQQERVAPNGGTIRISAERADGHAHLRFRLTPDSAAKGPAIPIEAVQWDGTLARLRGANLGLYLAQTILEMHGGTLAIETVGTAPSDIVSTIPLHESVASEGPNRG